MRCAVCGFVNAGTASACVQCGSALPLPDAAVPRAMFGGEARCVLHPDVEASGTCARCGNFGCGVCLQGSPAKCTTCCAVDSDLPWDRRDQLGTLKAFWQTSARLIQAPEKTLATTSSSGSVGSSLYFALLSTIAGYGTTMLLYMGIMVVAGGAALMQASKLDSGEASKVGMVGVVFGAVGLTLGLFVFQLVTVLLISALEHLVLKIAGAKPGDYSVTLRAHALGMAPYLVGLVPFCGAYIFPIWSMVVRGMALRKLQGTSGGLAAIAVVSPIAVACLTCGVGYAMLIGLVTTMSKSVGG